MVRNILDGLVAAGTLGLAGVTAWLAFVSRNATREEYKARVDSNSHRFIVTDLYVQGAPLQAPRVANVEPPTADPGTPWNLTQHGDVILGLRASATIMNEGGRSALVNLLVPRDVQGIIAVSTELPFTSEVAPTLDLGDGDGSKWHLLAPGNEAELLFTWWQTSAAWAESWGDDLPPPTRTVRIQVRDPLGIITDTCDLTFGAHVVMRKATDDGWMIAGPNMSSLSPHPPAPPVAIIGLVERTYAKR